MNPHPDPQPLVNPADPQKTAGHALGPAVNSHDLLRGQKTVSIDHNGERYRLQCTRSGKLILTK